MTVEKVSETLRVRKGRAKADVTFESALTPRVLIETSGMPAHELRAYSVDGLRDLAFVLHYVANLIEDHEEES